METAATGLGIYESANQFSKGGASGLLGGIGAASLTAGNLAGGFKNPLGAVLESVGLGTELLKALIPDPKEVRQAQIENQTAYNQYIAPPTLNRNLSAGGFETYTDKYGRLQVSPYSAIAETQPYKYQSPIEDPRGLLQNG